MNIVFDSVTLRAIENADLPLMHKWANDSSIQYMLGGWHFPTNMNDQEKWFQTLSCNSLNQRFIVENENKNILGMANLLNINFKDGNAELGLLLDPQFQGKGFGKKVVFALMRYSFLELRLNRLETSIISINESSQKLFINKCGWTKEGVLRNWYYRKGNFIDKFVLSILKDEFLKLEYL